MKKTLIYITGQIDNPFFTNEINSLVTEFDRVYVIAYAEKSNRCSSIAREYNFDYSIVNNKINLKQIIELLRWLKLDHVKREIHDCRKGMNALKKLVYLCVYGLLAIKINNQLKEVIDNEDILFFYSFWLSRGAYAVSFLKQIFNPEKTISRAHRYDLYENRNSLNYLPFRRYIAANIDEIAFISEDGKEYFSNLCEERSYKHNAFSVIHLGTFCNKQENQKLDFEKRKFVVASCSSMIDVKRIDLIIDTIKCLRKKIPDVVWFHIGDGPLMKHMEQYASKNLKTGYEFLGRIDNSEILNIYKQRNVSFFINMSDSEGIPVSLMEAISIGIPCIARNVGGNAEIVNNNTGLLLDSKVENINFENLCDEISNIFFDKNKYIKLCMSARTYWVNHFNAADNNQKLVAHILSDDGTVK